MNPAGRFAGRSVAVTGSADGIGRAIAEAFAREGAAVACLDVDGDGAASAARRCEELGAGGLAVRCDVTVWEEVTGALDRCVAAFGGVELLAANAGGSRGEAVPFLELDEPTWQRMVDRNLTSVFLSGLAFARHMAERGGGAIVVTSSQLSEVVRPGLAHYAAAKGGVRQLVRAMAVDLAPHGIRVNAVAPGPTMTPGTRAWFERPDVADANRRAIPLGRVAEPDEIAGAALYLASDDASYTTGASLIVDGGYTIV